MTGYPVSEEQVNDFIKHARKFEMMPGQYNSFANFLLFAEPAFPNLEGAIYYADKRKVFPAGLRMIVDAEKPDGKTNVYIHSQEQRLLHFAQSALDFAKDAVERGPDPRAR